MDKYIGKMLDNRYEILEIIGVGGMAMVYKARCHRLNRLVAVKILKDDYSRDDDFRRRFHAESQAVAMLSHPNIVSVFDVSRSAEVEYIVMELIDGITLKQYMQKKGVLNWREALHFVTQIVKALSHAHSRGIIHRDIKPHNIMILRDGSVKVADFGIARFASKQNTLTQEALGSVHYISPEQARGSHIDARSDLYSVGVVLYEMLTARLPYEGDSPVSVAIQHINSVPLSPKEINSEIPDALEMITLKAMSAQLSRRYSSAEVMLRDLEEFRKNPAISFDYDISDIRPVDMETDEPTRPLSGGGALAIVPNRSLRDNKSREEERRMIRMEIIEEENYKTRRSNSFVTVLVGVLGIIIFVGVMIGIAVNMIGPRIQPANTGDSIKVPNFKGMIYDLLKFETEYPEFTFDVVPVNDEYEEKNKILKQSRDPEELVAPKTTITLTVSLGPMQFALPDYAGAEFRSVQISLGKDWELYYDAANTTYERSDTVTKDYVIRTNPPQGSLMSKGDMVSLVISLGPNAKKVTVPNLIGQDEDAAAQRLEDRLLEKGEVTRVEDEAPAGQVISQNPSNGTQVDERTAINFTVSLGPPEDPSPSPSSDIEVSPSPSSDDTPSPSPSTSGSNEIMYKVKTIPLPTEEGSTYVTIYSEGILMHNGEYQNTTGSIQVTLVGYAGDLVEIYFNGNLYESYDLQP